MTRRPGLRVALGRLARRLTARRGEDGFSLVEVLVAMLLVVTITPLAFTMLRNLVEQNDAVSATVLGAEQDQTASGVLVRWLHGATVILPGSDATDLQASILAGTGGSSVPQSALLQAQLAVMPGGGAEFTTSVTPDGGPSRSVVSSSAVPSSSVFTYFYNSSTSTTTSTVAPTSTTLPAGLASTEAPTDAQLAEIVAVGVDATFLAGPKHGTPGAQSVQPTSFETTVYLQNASGAPAPASATTVSYTGGSTTGTPITATATVSPVPSAGTVQFATSYDGAATSSCPGPVDVSPTTGIATCTYTPVVAGTYGIGASFSGTSTLQPSTALPISFSVLSASSTVAGASRGPRSGTLVVTATVTSSPSGGPAPTGTADVTLVQRSGCRYGCSTTNTSGQLTTSGDSGVLSLTVSGLRSGASYAVTVTYAGDSTYASSVASATGSAA